MLTNQTEMFLRSVGDHYYARNREDFGKREKDPVITMLKATKIKPTSVLEVGCANGWRLKELKEIYGCHVRGIDPSAKAIADGQKDLGSDLQVGVAHRIPFADGSFDLVIFGYFMFLCEPDSWFQIIGEANRVLANSGHLAHYDYISARPLVWCYAPAEATSEEKDCLAWIYDHSKIWLSHPGYSLIAEGTGPCDMGKSLACQVAVIILKKDMIKHFAKPDDMLPGIVKT